MQLAHKVNKLFSGAALRSARQAVQRKLHPIAVSEVLQAVDTNRLEKIRKKYAVPGEETHWPKYLDAPRWTRLNIRRAQDLRLANLKRPLNILDLGSGAGYFLLVARYLGHTGTGLDLADPPMFGELFELFGFSRVIWEIKPFEPLPDFPQQFDLVTAFSVCFNGHKTPQLWTSREWEFFLGDLKKRILKPDGQVFLGLNPESRDVFYTPELKEFFLSTGATIDRAKIWFKSLERIPS
jgi:SAM-dependent methyltransferase